jgi:hypothetical protein
MPSDLHQIPDVTVTSTPVEKPREFCHEHADGNVQRLSGNSSKFVEIPSVRVRGPEFLPS